MKGGLALKNVDSAVDLDVLVKFSIRILIIFAVIFVLAYVTPKLAKVVDSWIKKYRQNHGKEETYGIRSIYELPPDPDAEEDPDDLYYDLEDDGEPYDEEPYDEEDYLLDEEFPEEQPPADTEPVHLFSFGKLEPEPYELDRKTVRFGKKITPDVEALDLSGVAFGQKGRPAMYEPVPEPDDDDDEFDATLPPLQYAPFEERFFDFDEEEPPAEPAPEPDDDLPWFMR